MHQKKTNKRKEQNNKKNIPVWKNVLSEKVVSDYALPWTRMVETKLLLLKERLERP